MKDVIFRKATVEDCRALSELKRDVWSTTYSGIYPQEKLDGYDVDKNEGIFRSFVERPNIELYLAENNGKPIGLMTVGKPYKLIMSIIRKWRFCTLEKTFNAWESGGNSWKLRRMKSVEKASTGLFCR